MLLVRSQGHVLPALLVAQPRFLRDLVTLFTWCLCWAGKPPGQSCDTWKRTQWQKEHRKLTHLGHVPKSYFSENTLSKHKSPRKLPRQGLPQTNSGSLGAKAHSFFQDSCINLLRLVEVLFSRCCSVVSTVRAQQAVPFPVQAARVPLSLKYGGEGTVPRQVPCHKTNLAAILHFVSQVVSVKIFKTSQLLIMF